MHRSIDAYYEESARNLAAQIDKSIVDDVVRADAIQQGWNKAPFTTDKFLWPFKHQIPDVSAWIHIYCTGGYRIIGNEFWFEKPTDLTAFILKWS